MKSFLPLLRGEWRLLLFGFAMTFGSSLGQTYFIALFSGEIRSDLGLSHTDFGAIYSLATLASAVLLLWTGSLIDRMDLRHYAYMATIGLASGCLLLAASQNVAMLLLAILVLRHTGQGLMSMAGGTSMVRYLGEHRGKASAISGMGYSISEAVLPSLVIALLAIMSWRAGWMVWAAVMLLGMPLLVRLLLHDHQQRHANYLASVMDSHDGDDRGAPRRRQWTRDQVLRDPVFYLFLPALLGMPLLFTGFMFHQVQLVAEKGWSLPVWGSLYVLYALVSVLMKLFAGLLIDRFGAIRLVPIMPLPLGLALLLLASSSHLAAAIGFMFFLGVGVGTYATVASPFFAEAYGTLHLGSIKSVSTALMVFASAIAPVLMGWLIDRGASIDSMALGGVVYVVVAVGLARYARMLSLARQ